MANVGTLNMQLLANATGFQNGLRQASGALSSFQQRVSSFGSGITGQLAGMFGGAATGGFFGWGVKLAADAQVAQASFTVLTGSAARARAMLAEIKQVSQSSSLSQSGMRDAATTMLSFGVAAESILPKLKQFGDITGGDSDRMKSLALAFSQMSAAGRLMGQDLLQMINAGFNPLQEISKKTGTSLVDLKKQMEDGAISSKMVSDAFTSATSAGGMFHGRLAAVAQTAQGQFNQMKAAVENAALSWGQVLIPMVAKGAQAVADAAKWFGDLTSSTKIAALQTVAFIATWAATAFAISKVIVAGRAIITTLRGIATAQAIVQALSGPKGWIALGVAIAATAASIAVVDSAFAGVEKAAAQAGQAAAQAAKDAKEFADAAMAVGPAVEGFEGLAKAIKKIQFQKTDADRIADTLDDMMKRGAEITKEMRNPAEVLRDTGRELRDLFAVGAISGETFNRAMADARKKAAEARGDLEAIEHMRKGVGAAAVGTKEGFSAVQEALRNADADRAKEQLLRKRDDAARAAGEHNIAALDANTKALIELGKWAMEKKGGGQPPIEFKVADF